MKIAVLTNRFLEDYVNSILETFRKQADIQVFFYENSEETAQVFRGLQEEFDGFLVNGVITNAIIHRCFPGFDKPIEYFNMDMVSYCQGLIKIFLTNREIDLSRVFVDISVFFKETSLEEILMAGTIEEMGMRYLDWVGQMELDELLMIKSNLEAELLAAWRAGEIECVLTRFTTLIPVLEENHIPYYFTYPAKEYVRDSFRKLLSDVRVSMMKNSLPAVIVLSLKGGGEIAELEELSIQKALMEYAREIQADFTIRRKSRTIEIITNVESVRKLTGDFTSCRLKPYLEKELHHALCVGYGIGDELALARINAMNASQEAALSVDGSSYLMDRDENLIGPLSGNGRMVLATMPDAHLANLAKEAGVSVLNLQKIQAVIHSLGSDEVTARLLSEKMGISVRAVNRLLVRLLQADCARLSGTRRGKTKGRPEQVYQVILKK